MPLLNFELDLETIEEKIANFDKKSGSKRMLEGLEAEKNKMLEEIYSSLSALDKTQIARHPARPHTIDYIEQMVDNFVLLKGDRAFAEDEAIIGGIGKLNGNSVVIMGHEKGHDLESRLRHNFGMPKPEGYRKAQRLLALAEKFALPVITLVDTAGAFPGLEAEARGQAEAIAKSIQVFLDAKVPIFCIIIGEGGSGGAIAIAAANYIMMLENSIYSVISPEGCASILWRDAAMSKEASEALKLTAKDLKELKVIDEIIPEKKGGAHRHKSETIKSVKAKLSNLLEQNKKDPKAFTKEQRAEKFLKMTVL